jgi:phage tail sheath protein FI
VEARIAIVRTIGQPDVGNERQADSRFRKGRKAMKIRHVWVIAACLAAVAGTALVHGGSNQADAGKAALEQQLKDLLKQRVESAERALEAMQAAYNAETVIFTDLVEAANKVVEAKSARADTPKEKIAALENHVDFVKNQEAKIGALYKEGARGGEQAAYYTAKRERESAEIGATQCPHQSEAMTLVAKRRWLAYSQ